MYQFSGQKSKITLCILANYRILFLLLFNTIYQNFQVKCIYLKADLPYNVIK